LFRFLPVMANSSTNSTNNNTNNAQILSTVESLVPSMIGGWNWRLDNFSNVQNMQGLSMNASSFNRIVTINGVPFTNESFNAFASSNVLNGELFVFDYFLLPPLQMNTVSSLNFAGLTQIFSLLKRASPHVLSLLELQSVTFFAPTDDAFVALNNTLAANGMNWTSLNQSQIDWIIMNHIVNLNFSLFTIAVNSPITLPTALNNIVSSSGNVSSGNSSSSMHQINFAPSNELSLFLLKIGGDTSLLLIFQLGMELFTQFPLF